MVSLDSAWSRLVYFLPFESLHFFLAEWQLDTWTHYVSQSSTFTLSSLCLPVLLPLSAPSSCSSICSVSICYCCSGFQVVTPEISKMGFLCLLFREYAKKCVFLFNRDSFRYISWSLQMVNLTKGYLWNHYSTNFWIKVLKCINKCNFISPS